MCDKAVEKDPWSLMNVPDYFKKQDTCIESVEKYPLLLVEVPKICNEAVEIEITLLVFVPDCFKTQ